ncbi:MAG: hypothetical protein HFJ55_00470 [Clostridia bacterium]|nr:hypothetical protein [Clostridia bacterium]
MSIALLLGENGIIIQATQAKENSKEAEAREKLELTLLSAYNEKILNAEYNQNEYLNNIIKSEIEEAEIKGDVVIVDGYAYELDRSVPKIERYLGKEKDLIFPEVEAIVELAEDAKTAKIKIKAKEETKGINKIEIWVGKEKIDEFSYNNEKMVIKEYQAKRNGNYTIKVYADLSDSATIEVLGLIPTIDFLPNGSTTYKKEHTTKVIVKETNEKIKKIKYRWTTSIKEPAENEFTEECSSENMVIGKDVTGIYYLWILMETETGKKNIFGSEAFYFDNEAPIVTLSSIPETETSFTLTATANDMHSGIKKYEFYINNRLVDTQITTDGVANYAWNGSEMTNTNGYVVVKDNAENTYKVEIEMRTKLHFWEEYDLQERVPGHLEKEELSERISTSGTFRRFMIHNDEVNHIYYTLDYINFFDGNVLTISEDLNHLNIKEGAKVANGGKVRGEFIVSHGVQVFSIKCLECESGALIKSWSKDANGYITCNGISYNWVKEIPEGPKGEKIKEVFSTNELLKPKNGKDNGKWYKYIGIK